MLWVPIGRHDFLLKHWMKVGTFIAPLLLLVAAAFQSACDEGLSPRALWAETDNAVAMATCW